MKPLAPSFVQQRQLEQALRCVLRQVGSRATDRPADASELDGLVRATLTAVTAEVGERFWCHMNFSPAGPVVPRPERPTQPPTDAILITLGDDQRHDAEAALWYARLHAIPFVPAALQAYAVHCAAARLAPPLRQCVDDLLAEKHEAGCSPVGMRNFRCDLAPFVKRFGDRQPGELTVADIEGFLKGERNPAAARYRAARLSAFFTWAFRRRYAVDNPVPVVFLRPRLPRRPLFVFTPRQARYILWQTRHTDQIGYWVLGFFAGLGTGEIKRLDRHPVPWSLVRLRSGELDVPEDMPDTIKRTLRMSPVLRSWLEWLRSRGVPFFPRNFWEKKFPDLWKAALRKFPDGRTARTGYRKPERPRRVFRIARDTHITYRLALPGATLEEVARDIGEVVRFMRRHHDPTMTPRRARDFFALSPDNI